LIAQGQVSVREILAATDFSRSSHQAFEAALALAQHFDARLHVLHVISDSSKHEMAQSRLDALTAEQSDAIKMVRTVSIGHAASEIVKYAAHEKIDLIVLGTHGRGGLARVLMGSVAEAVVRTAPCQILTIGPKAHAMEEKAIPVQAVPMPPESHCYVCAKPSQQSICDTCKAHIQGEALERKRRDEQAGHKGLNI
jgi:nucleotide-binding universal stress UspA family protein